MRMRRHRVTKPISIAAVMVWLLVWTASHAPSQQPESARAEIHTIDVTARGVAFDKEILTVPAGARVAIDFVNEDRIPHNVSVYESPKAREVIYYGKIINGLEAVRYEFTAPEQPGVYFFRCDLHPLGMIGSFAVE